MIKQSVKSIASLGLVLVASLACASAPEKVDLGELYDSYLEHNQSSMNMPQFKKEILISGSVLGVSKNFSGEAVMEAGLADSDEVLARLTGFDADESNKMDAMAVGTDFKAVCVLAMTMGSEYMALTDCVFKP
ncbi:hypothetical protein C1Y08_25515 [Pseudomonas sp. FW306-02-F02-AA]|uniref:Lipoprotein n=1 Tax=Pseudomonas fluorescens TaxID=294 RepID=A0A0N9WYL7_PSEFL|nr:MULTISPECIES: hypothetical protein [Pseudomonas]ALI03329.1 hypothetical protein AO353_20435 [Pseudomonas fluorescens]PMZ00763.1 hypothetical protein C1Y07_28805 [Pseudomonas sp. FW306-02-F02-AB]PMZ07331.1 hypothetical protein C1Y06_25435 [Pseudomonas sp. FW306-02-H06C]PMZ13057.1 hypothetical protein C1Y08_25515 [Pseudomonas sp. FW306-02-F02-AA]PMZ18922.1 hypothetical protein C1Y09_26995 [Pseudomonas sp. FW306-02-F08-AA]